MKDVPYCVSEIIDLVFATARMVSEDLFIHKKILAKILVILQENAEEDNPAELTLACLRATYQALGVKDPYEKEKARQIRSMLGLENTCRDYINSSSSRLKACIRLSSAACGESLKGLGREDMEQTLVARLEEKPAINVLDQLIAAAEKAKKVLIIASGAGELVADGFLAEELSKTAQVEVVVANRPLFSRATAADADAAGITKFATVSDPGADMLGIITGRATNTFNEKLASADLVIAKGSINYLTLAGCERGIFHIFRCEREETAQKAGVPRGSGVICFRPGEAHDEED